MAQITINIPDAQLERVEEAFAKAYGYAERVDDGSGNLVPNPLTKREFLRTRLRQYVKEVVGSAEVETAAQKARDKAQAKVEAELG